MQTAAQPSQAPTTRPRPPRGARALFAVACVEAVLVFLQAAFAGQFLAGNGGWLGWHAANATLLEALALVQLVLAIAMWRPGGGPAWPLAVSTLQLMVVGMQVGAGYERQLALHVPLGVALFGLTLALAAGTGRLAWKKQAPGPRGPAR